MWKDVENKDGLIERRENYNILRFLKGNLIDAFCHKRLFEEGKSLSPLP